MRTFTVTELKILEALAQFQYLTSSQMVRMGILKNRQNLYPHLSKLSKEHRPSIARVHYNVSPVHGRQESTVYLTRYGVQRLVESGYEPEAIKYPRRSAVSFATDYLHRLWTVDFFIALKNWTDASQYELTDFYYYFQQSTGTNRNNKGGRSLSDNRIDIDLEGVSYIVPDGVAIVDRGHAKPVFVFFEQHNGKDTKRFLQQVHGHILAIREGIPSIKYGVKYGGQYISNRVFCAFQFETCMEASMHRLAKSEQFKPYIDYFYFQTTENINKGHFEDGWQLANGKNVEI